MTRDVVIVSSQATVREIASLFVRHHISAVPVVTLDNRLIGIVSQTDLLHRIEIGTDKRRKWWLDILADSNSLALEYIKRHGRTARDVMTRKVLFVSSGSTLSEVAEILDTNGIRQVPVVDDGKVVGMISRTDLVRKLAESEIVTPAARPTNGLLLKAIWERIKAEPWLNSAHVALAIKDGVVDLHGAVESAEQRHALKVLIEGVSGVQKVKDSVVLLPRLMTEW